MLIISNKVIISLWYSLPVQGFWAYMYTNYRRYMIPNTLVSSSSWGGGGGEGGGSGEVVGGSVDLKSDGDN